MKQRLILLLALAQAMFLSAAEQFVVFEPQTDAFALNNLTIACSEQEYEGVKIAIGSLQSDIERVLGAKPALIGENAKAGILIGTIGKNAEIDQLKLANLKGKREKFVITSVDDKLVIAGSDKRGTIYGVYELSRQLGVSPWYWWADVPVVKRELAYIKRGIFTDEEPAD